MHDKRTCYMCDNIETSKEHVPPKCFFPEKQGMRINLFTVPACDLHNTMKSTDDEFFRTIILSNKGLNSIGKELFLGKTLRAVKRKPHAYGEFIKPIEKQFHSDEVAVRFDRVRLDKCIEQMVKAIFYLTYKKKLSIPMVISCPKFGSKSRKGNYYNSSKWSDIANICRDFLCSEIVLGENHKVFNYRIKYDSTENVLGFAAIFYESFEIFVIAS